MKEFLSIFGDYSVGNFVTLILAIVFMAGIYLKNRKHVIEQYKEQELKDKMLQEALDEIKKYPGYRQQSMEIQKELTDSIKRIESNQEEYSKRLEIIEEKSRKRELNKLRDRLIQSYRYYTSDKNPTAAWTRMESEAYWEMFKDYEDLQGNGYIHSVVEPAMRLLTVIEMDDSDKVTQLMSSRK